MKHKQAEEPREPPRLDSWPSTGSFTILHNKRKDGARGENFPCRTMAVESGLAGLRGLFQLGFPSNLPTAVRQIPEGAL